jgi:hypothetical protein
MKENKNLALVASRGFSLAWRERKIGFLLFSIQSVMALFLVLPLHSKWSALLDHSRMGADVTDGFGANFFAEFLARHSDLVPVEALWTIGFALAALFMNLFFNGGMIACFTGSKKNGLPFFLEKSARFFGRLLRLFLLSLPLLIAALILQSLLGRALQAIAGESESWRVVFLGLQFAVSAALLFFINMAFDYAKIITVYRNRKDMFRTVLRAFRFVLGNPRTTLGLYYGIGAAGLALAGGFIWIGRRLDFPTGFGLLLLFSWTQILALTRIAVRMEFYASQSALYRILSAKPEKRRRKEPDAEGRD